MKKSTSTLCSLLRKHLAQWPSGARCACQNERGDILFWRAPPETVRGVIEKPNPYQYNQLQRHSLCLIDTLFDEDDRVFLACDRPLSVVTIEDFVGV
ncbi:hypothetical protein [Photobacterium damselae]|uniref:Uncharacterized protein n=1 Tax=Photobacterium damselae TaxID=38293 RepID=A0A2T3Q8G4_PHODM|nr:hypothetical protein [Photobacterium damselae]PSW80319.1 hypothetical protein CTN07_20030 [Photobacterium damselae]SPY45172.1 Uncharacterised protein [Photobacterium damselae]